MVSISGSTVSDIRLQFGEGPNYQSLVLRNLDYQSVSNGDVLIKQLSSKIPKCLLPREGQS